MNIFINFVFYISLSNIFGVFKTAYCTSYGQPSGNVNTKTPISLDLYHEASTNQFIFYISDNKEEATFEAYSDVAFQTVGFKPNKFIDGHCQELYESESPSKRAYKVIIYKKDLRNKIEIYLLNGEVITFVKPESEQMYIRESVDETSQQEPEKRSKQRFATDKGLLYCILIILSIVLLGVVAFGTIYFHRKIKQESRNLISGEVMV